MNNKLQSPFRFIRQTIPAYAAAAVLALVTLVIPAKTATAANTWTCYATINGQTATNKGSSTECTVSKFYNYLSEAVEVTATRYNGRSYCTAYYYQWANSRWTPRYSLFSYTAIGNKGCWVSSSVKLGARNVTFGSKILTP